MFRALVTLPAMSNSVEVERLALLTVIALMSIFWAVVPISSVKNLKVSDSVEFSITTVSISTGAVDLD